MPKAKQSSTEPSNVDGGAAYPSHHPYAGRSCVVVHDHDVLNGRGVNMAHHPGNKRFRSLIKDRSDPSYCAAYSTIEKKALAEDIVRHIYALTPPGRFLKRSAKSKNRRGLQGPWEIMAYEEAVKKARQALRDCNRPDRQGYARGVEAPEDVVESTVRREQAGLSQQQYAQQLAASTNEDDEQSEGPSPVTSASADFFSSSRHPRHPSGDISLQSPDANALDALDPFGSSFSNGPPEHHFQASSSWMSHKYMHSSSNSISTTNHTPIVSTSTPTTAATSGGFLSAEAADFPDSYHHPNHHIDDHTVDVVGTVLDSPIHSHFEHHLPSSPAGLHEALAVSLEDEDDSKPPALGSYDSVMPDDSGVDPVTVAAVAAGDDVSLNHEAAAALSSALDGVDDFDATFPDHTI